MKFKISSAQMRAARALLRWSALDLAKASKVGVATIRRVEVVEGEIPVTDATRLHFARRWKPQASSLSMRTVEAPVCVCASHDDREKRNHSLVLAFQRARSPHLRFNIRATE